MQILLVHLGRVPIDRIHWGREESRREVQMYSDIENQVPAGMVYRYMSHCGMRNLMEVQCLDPTRRTWRFCRNCFGGEMKRPEANRGKRG